MLQHGKTEPFFDRYWFRFLVGGFVVATTASLATYVNTALGAILWSAPITLLPTLFFMWSKNVPAKKVSKFAYQTFISLLNLLLFVLCLSYLLKMKYFKENKNGILYAIPLSLTIWVAGSVLLYYYQ